MIGFMLVGLDNTLFDLLFLPVDRLSWSGRITGQEIVYCLIMFLCGILSSMLYNSR